MRIPVGPLAGASHVAFLATVEAHRAFAKSRGEAFAVLSLLIGGIYELANRTIILTNQVTGTVSCVRPFN